MFVVTGASTGIGRATAQALAELECSVLAVARTESLLNDLSKQFPDQVSVLAADLASDDGLNALANTLDRVPQAQGLVHAAGTLISPQRYQQLTSAELIRAMQVHVAAPIEINKRLINKLQGGKIVYIDSFSALAPRNGWSGYSIVKAAAQMAARAAAEELQGLDVIRVFPGAVQTPLVENLLDSSQPSQVKELFGTLAKEGQIVEAKLIGQYIANILLYASRDQMKQREYWDYTNGKDRLF